LESRLNKLVVSIFVLNAIVLLLSSILSGSWQVNLSFFAKIKNKKNSTFSIGTNRKVCGLLNVE